MTDELAGRVRDGTDAVERRLLKVVPDRVKRRFVGPYNRLQVFRADRAFRRRSLPDVQVPGDAPDHLVWVVVDALRADLVSFDTAPFVAERSQGSLVAPSPWTFPSVTSMVTGQYPHEHGSMRQSDDPEEYDAALTLPPKLPADRRTILDLAAGAGYDTYGAFAFHMPFFALSGRFGDHALYDDADAETVLGDYLDWAREAGDRTFAYIHLSDLHEPVDPPSYYWRTFDVDEEISGIRGWRYASTVETDEATETYRRHRRRLYLAALGYVNDRLAWLRDHQRDALDGDVGFVLVGDHGEGFWEHAAFDAETFHDSRPAYCVDHGGTPYEPIVRVPFATEGLGDVGLDDEDGRGSLVDLAPTLARVLGREDWLPSAGHDLAEGVPSDRIPLVEATRYGHERKAAYLDDWKLVASYGDDVTVGFSLPDEEPTELPTDVEHRLLDAMPPWPDGDDPGNRVSAMAQERLEDLGYI